ncbi:hypothetical protein NW766_012756 [Fusarium irregulare]|uniref:Uncharacterized protein n=1 Tax=Fusarium irregulare TaxID=2494466 RepID=A0A9W8PEA5_9HYPO|nr:hypothetical protein NW766_012756 [Fusarium irregulare]
MATLAHLQPVPTIEPHSSVTSTPQSAASTPAPTGPHGPHWTEADVPEWLRKHMRFWQVEPTPIRARTWMLEGLDHIQANRLDLPQHLDGIKVQLRRVWDSQNKRAAGRKRKSDASGGAPAKKAKGTTPIKSEREAQMPPPPPKLLGNLKGKYAIETDFRCCEGHSDRAHDALCHITLYPATMGNFNDYKILMFFEKRPTEVSSVKVWFKWRGRKGYGSNRKYRGDENHGWVKFRGNGEIEVWFDKIRVHLIAQKGRALGDKNKHNVHAFWGDWHEYDEEEIDLLDTSKLFPDW